jgi:hypothetical protein
MALDLPGGVVQVQEEVLAGEVLARVEWEVTAPEPDPVGIAFAPVAGRRLPTRQELPAIT